MIIKDTIFEGNTVNPNDYKAGGGGLAVEFTRCKFLSSLSCSNDNQIKNTVYTIQDSTFTKNSAHQLNPKRLSYDLTGNQTFAGLGRGGGIYFSMRGNATGNRLVIENCTFADNTASTNGGGMYLALNDNSNTNNITVSNSNFIHNKCDHYGGGGLVIYSGPYIGNSISYTIVVEHSKFTSNVAKMGGGLCDCLERNHTAVSPHAYHYEVYQMQLAKQYCRTWLCN